VKNRAFMTRLTPELSGAKGVRLDDLLGAVMHAVENSCK
jgi:hypothetical protein